MKKFYLSLVCLIVPFLIQAQANKWITYSQNYYKIKVAKDGIYRIDSITLANAGIPIGSINPKNIQLYFRGQQQYIYIRGEADGVFNGPSTGGDYIEFYGQHNSGSLINDAASDSMLYAGINSYPDSNITAVPNPYYSMFNDTSTYFLTWSGSAGFRVNYNAPDLNFSSFIPYPYFMTWAVNYATTASNNYCAGSRFPIVAGESVNDPRYTPAAGWFFAPVYMGSQTSYAVPVANVYGGVGAPTATVKTFFEGQSTIVPITGADHEIQVTASWSTSILSDDLYAGFATFPKMYQVSASTLANNLSNPVVSLTFRFPNVSFVTTLPYSGVSYVSVFYPHTPNLSDSASFMMYVRDTTPSTETYLNLNNFKVNAGDTVRLYDLTTHSRFLVTQNAGYKVLMPNTTGLTRQCYIAGDAQVNKVTKLIPVGNKGSFTQSFKGAFKNPYIIIYPTSLTSSANAYYSYRLKKYGSNLIYANIEELYDQFSYGIEKDPLAIRNFCSYILNESGNTASGLFLIGKAIHSNMYRQDAGNYNATLVPSFGSPSSDNLLTTGLNPKWSAHALQPVIPTGRLAAVTNTDVSNYLAKVETYESITPALWQKNIMHFSGGGDASEQSFILSCLNTDASVAEGTFFGANVYTFQKTSTAPIQITLSDSVANIINNGVALMTFFGHASGDNFDINLDAPSDYNNVGKYPMILALACFSGDIFQPVGEAVSSTSEQFVLSQKGSIGFIAMDDVAELGHLCNYSYTFYNDFSKSMYRQPIAACMQNVVAATEGSGLDLIGDYMCMEMQLHGEPGITIAINDSLPDYAVNDSSLTFIPTDVTTQTDSFKVKLTVQNLAEATGGPVQVEIDRLLPGNDTTVTKLITLHNIYNQRDTILTFPVNKVNGVGMNYFTVKVDPFDLIPKEITKSNNDISHIPLWITSGDIIPIYPYQFAIIPKDTATLKASTGDPFASAHNYIFEIDTTIYFNSGFLKSQMVNAKGGVVRSPWNTWVSTPFAPPITATLPKGNVMLKFKDSTVYYWRVRRDTIDVKDYGWQVSSFQYITGKFGWGQSHYFQFDNNTYSYLEQQMKLRNWVFDPTGKTLQCNTYGIVPGTFTSNETQANNTGYFLDLNIGSYNSCTVTPALCLAVIHPISLTPWSNQFYNLGNVNTASSGCIYPDGKFLYWYNDSLAVKGLVNALTTTIPNGDYILIYSFMEGMLHSIKDKNALDAELISLGALPTVATVSDNIPWIFFVKKGDPSSAQTIFGADSVSAITLTNTLLNNSYFGSMVSPLIGPAQKWDSISWRQHPMVKNAHDSVKINVIGVNNAGAATTLMQGISPSLASFYINSLNPALFPYLQLMLYTEDAVTRTPSQMNKWQVFYTPVPEVAVNPSIYTSFYANNVTGGDTIRFSTVVQNVSDLQMDSMLVNAWVVDPNGSSHYFPVKNTKKLNPGDTTLISVKTSSSQYSGNNSIWIEVNPEGSSKTRPEEYHFNNLAKKTFIATGDKNQPLLDVTFDGVHILNNDIVSPHPNILMEVTSDSKFLALNNSDTGNIAVYIRNVNNPTPQRIYFGSQTGTQLQFTPAVLPNNKCAIAYSPTLPDGTYELSVQAADRSNNLSASNSYKVNFVVINKSSITNVLNYPNPFSTSTRFVFTLTGDQVPTYFKIQIMTITGKVVREITEAELGPLHIGRNITQYAWDGTDQFGSKLANGVYLYKVTTSIDNQAIDHLSTDADSYFTKGWGKMYILK